jgi:predicted aldo/keto reductase-like oxidoreductase
VPESRGKPGGGLRRREFLQRGTVTALGVGALGPIGADAAAAADSPPRVRRRKKLGKTGLEIPDISFGTSNKADRDLIAYAFDRGVTYFDTAEGYPLSGPDGGAETALGLEFADKRDQVVIASKQVSGPDDPRGRLMERLEASLRRLRTDYIDIYFNHAVNDVKRMQNPEWAEFISLAKKQGKIRFCGMSGHGGNLAECLTWSLDNEAVDVILTAYNFGQEPWFWERFTRRFDVIARQPQLPAILKRAHAAGVGTIAMKTLMGGYLNDMGPFERGGTFAQAAFRWTLSNPNVDALIVSMSTREKIDEHLAASGSGPPASADLELLRRHAARNGSSHCRQGCGECSESCPFGVPIADVLRSRMYAVDYGDVAGGRATYSSLSNPSLSTSSPSKLSTSSPSNASLSISLGVDASPCLSCANPACASACPYGLDIPSLTRTTPEILGIS